MKVHEDNPQKYSTNATTKSAIYDNIQGIKYLDNFHAGHTWSTYKNYKNVTGEITKFPINEEIYYVQRPGDLMLLACWFFPDLEI